MPVAGVEWILLVVIIIVVIIVVIWWIRRRAKRNIEDLSMRVLAIIRSKGGKASLDDIIVIGGVPPRLIDKVMGNLLDRGIIKIVDEEGKIVYTLT